MPFTRQLLVQDCLLSFHFQQNSVLKYGKESIKLSTLKPPWTIVRDNRVTPVARLYPYVSALPTYKLRCSKIVSFICRCRLARVTTLVKKKEQLSCDVNSQQAMTAEDASDADADVQELEEFLDWRSKKAWK